MISDVSDKSKKEIIDGVKNEVEKLVDGLKPTGTYNIDTNGKYNIKDFGYVNVEVLNPARHPSEVLLEYKEIDCDHDTHAAVTCTIGTLVKTLILQDADLKAYVNSKFLKDKILLTSSGEHDVAGYQIADVKVEPKYVPLEEYNQNEIKEYAVNNLLNEFDIKISDIHGTDDDPYITISVGNITKDFYISDEDATRLFANVPNHVHTLDFKVDGTDFVTEVETGIYSMDENLQTNFIKADTYKKKFGISSLKEIYEQAGHTLILDPTGDDIDVERLYVKEDGRVYVKVYFNDSCEREIKLNQLDYRTVAKAIDYKFQQNVTGDSVGNILINEQIKMLCPHERNIYPLTEDNIRVDVDTAIGILRDAGHTVDENISISPEDITATYINLDSSVFAPAIDVKVKDVNKRVILSSEPIINDVVNYLKNLGYTVTKN